MYRHRTYAERSDDFDKMVGFVTRLNSLRLCDWSLGRLYGWKYGRWSTRSQDDAEFEKQAELFYDTSDNLRGIIITENFGNSYYLLSEKNENIIHCMIDFLEQNRNFSSKYSIIVSEDDVIPLSVLKKNNYKYQADADITYHYCKDKLALPDKMLPDHFILSDQECFNDNEALEKQRFFSFNPDGEYDDVIDKAYKYCRNNPLLVPSLGIVLLDENNSPVSSCVGYWDKENHLMEIEVVATKAGYENRGFAKIVISHCIRRGLDLGVVMFSISAWEEKTRRLYSSFGEYDAVKKVKYGK